MTILKGLCQLFLVTLSIEKPKVNRKIQNSPVLLKLTYECIKTISKCFKLQMARMEMDYNLKRLDQLFQIVSLCLRKIT